MEKKRVCLTLTHFWIWLSISLIVRPSLPDSGGYSYVSLIICSIRIGSSWPKFGLFVKQKQQKGICGGAQNTLFCSIHRSDGFDRTPSPLGGATVLINRAFKTQLFHGDPQVKVQRVHDLHIWGYTWVLVRANIDWANIKPRKRRVLRGSAI